MGESNRMKAILVIAGLGLAAVEVLAAEIGRYARETNIWHGLPVCEECENCVGQYGECEDCVDKIWNE